MFERGIRDGLHPTSRASCALGWEHIASHKERRGGGRRRL
jgi:hypothetical protein